MSFEKRGGVMLEFFFPNQICAETCCVERELETEKNWIRHYTSLSGQTMLDKPSGKVGWTYFYQDERQ